MPDLAQPIFSTTTFPPDEPEYQDRVSEMKTVMDQLYLDLVEDMRPLEIINPTEAPFIDGTGSNPTRESSAAHPTISAEDLAAQAYNEISRVHDDNGAVTIFLNPKSAPSSEPLVRRASKLRFPFDRTREGAGPDIQYRFILNPPADERPVVNDQQNHIAIR